MESLGTPERKAWILVWFQSIGKTMAKLQRKRESRNTVKPLYTDTPASQDTTFLVSIIQFVFTPEEAQRAKHCVAINYN